MLMHNKSSNFQASKLGWPKMIPGKGKYTIKQRNTCLNIADDVSFRQKTGLDESDAYLLIDDAPSVRRHLRALSCTLLQ